MTKWEDFMMNPNRLIKLGSFVVLCLAVAYPVCAMEQDRGKDKSPDIPSTVAHVKDTYVAYNEASTLDAATDLTDMFDNLYLHNWRCPICLEGTEEKCDEIVTLRNCGHKVHRQCIDQFLNQGASAARLCPLCRQAHELRRNLFAMIEQQFCPILDCDPSTIEGVSEELIVCYQQLMQAQFQLMQRALDCLSVEQLNQVHAFFRSIILNQSPVINQHFQRSMAYGMKLGMQMANGVSITKQMIRELYAPLFESQEELQAEAEKQGTLLKELLCRLLKEQSKDDLVEQLMHSYKECLRVGQDNKAALTRFGCECTVNELFRHFSSPVSLLTAAQGIGDYGNTMADEIRISQSERNRVGIDILTGAFDQLQQQNASNPLAQIDLAANESNEEASQQNNQEDAPARQENDCSIQ